MRTDFEKLYDEYYEKIYVYIARRVNNLHDAEDLTTDVFFKVFTHPYNPELAKFSTYIFTVASNVLKNHYRDSAKYTEMTNGDEPDENLPCDTNILESLITWEEYAELKNVLAMLPEQQYTVIYRRYYLEQSFKEIGAALHVTEDNAKKIHKRTLLKMKKLLI